MFNEKTPWQSFCLFATFVMGAGLVWTSAESLSLSFEYVWPDKVVLYLIALVMVSLAILGLRRIKSVFTDEQYISDKPWRLVSGITIYVFALTISMAGSIHNAYYRMTHTEMQEQEVAKVYRDLSQVGDEAKARVDKSINEYDKRVEKKLGMTLAELTQPGNKGPGPFFNKYKLELEAELGVETLDFVSPRAPNSSPSESAKTIFVEQVRSIKNRVISAKREAGTEITKEISSADYKNLVLDLAKLQREYTSARSDEASRLLKTAFQRRNDLAKRLDRLEKAVNQQTTNQEIYPERPPSIDIQKVAYFFGQVFSGQDRKDGGVVSRSKVMWSLFFGFILELGLVSFFYFGYLESRDN